MKTTPYKTSQITKPERDAYRSQLQAKHPKGGERFSTTLVYGKALADDFQYVWDFIDQSLDIDMAKAVILRRAVILYRQHLMNLAAEWHRKAKKMTPLEALDAFQAVMEMERDEIMHASGKKKGKK